MRKIFKKFLFLVPFIFAILLFLVPACLASNSYANAPTVPYSHFSQDAFSKHSKIDWVMYDTSHTYMVFKTTSGAIDQTLSPMTSSFREKLVEHDITVREFPSSIWGLVGGLAQALLPFLFIGGLVLWSIKRQMSVFESHIKITTEKPNVNMKDVAGIDYARTEITEVVDMLKQPERYTKMGVRVPKGILLIGPPGTGKTLIAKAMANESRMSFIAVSGSDFVEKYVGVGAQRVRELFEKAKSSAPAIIFVDEIDAFAGNRDTTHSESAQTLNQLLVCMDGFEATDRIVVIAATNLGDRLDPAILRPGRFDRHINVSLPDRKARLDILRVHARNKKIDPSVSMERIANMTVYMSGAELENLLNEAAILSVRDRKDTITDEHINQAFDRIVTGNKLDAHTSKFDQTLVAYHESGHAILGLLHNREISKVTILPTTKGAGGYTLFAQPEGFRTKEYQLQEIEILLGGRSAEEIQFGAERITAGAANDLEVANKIVGDMVCKYGMSDIGLVITSADDSRARREIKRILDEQYSKAHSLLEKHQDVLDAMSAELMEKETLFGEDLERYKEMLFVTE